MAKAETVISGAATVADPPKAEPKLSAGQTWSNRVLGTKPKPYADLAADEPLKEGERIRCGDGVVFKVKYQAGQLPTTTALGADGVLQIERKEIGVKAVVGKSFSRNVVFEDDSKRAAAQMTFLSGNGCAVEETIEVVSKIIDNGK